MRVGFFLLVAWRCWSRVARERSVRVNQGKSKKNKEQRRPQKPNKGMALVSAAAVSNEGSWQWPIHKLSRERARLFRKGSTEALT